MLIIYKHAVEYITAKHTNPAIIQLQPNNSQSTVKLTQYTLLNPSLAKQLVDLRIGTRSQSA
jgi:hypothetical protein